MAQRVLKDGGGYLDDIMQVDAGRGITVALDNAGSVWA